MPCSFRSERRPPADPSTTGCQFAVPETALIGFAGRMWCPFHLPFAEAGHASGKSEWDADSLDAFHHAVRAFINMAAAGGAPADLSGVAFPGEATFEAFAEPGHALPAVVFDGARFGGDADFVEVAFAGPALFSRAEFDGDADFIVAAFMADADFSGTVFHGAFDAAEARFAGRASFRDCVFEGPALFRETRFSRPPDFTGARFRSPPVFDHAALPEGTRLPIMP